MVNAAGQQKKRGPLIASIGALVGIGAFLLLPFFTITIAVTPLGYTGYQAPTYNETFTVGTGLIELFSGIIWIEALLAAAILVVTGLVIWREAPFGSSTTPVATQLRRAAYTILILGVIGIVFQFLFVSAGSSQANDALQSASLNSSAGSVNLGQLLTRSNTSISLAIGYGIGSWIYLLGMCGAIAGGVLMLNAGGVRVAMPHAAQQPVMEQPHSHEWHQIDSYPQQQPSQSLQQGWQAPSQPLQQGWQPPQPSQPLQQGWQPPSQPLQRQSSADLRRPSTQDWQGWQQPPSSPLQ